VVVPGADVAAVETIHRHQGRDPGLEGIVPRARPEEAAVGQAGEPETEQRATLTGPAAETGMAALA
jgi:hypothetical protein